MNEKTDQTEAAVYTEATVTASGATKRIIKKALPEILQKRLKTTDDSDWKPKTLNEIKSEAKTSQADKKKYQLALSFALPKPKNDSDHDFKPRFTHHKKQPPKPLLDLTNPTDYQIKYDIEDKSFIVKEFDKPNPNPNKKYHLYEYLIRQEDLPYDFKGIKITNIKMDSLIDYNWKEKEKYRKMRMATWYGAAQTIAAVTGVDRYKNQLNALLEDAMKRAEYIDFEATKKNSERMAMKKRYGW